MGILNQFPDLTEVLNDRGALVNGLRRVTDPLPIDPGTLTVDLTEGLAQLKDAIPSDPQAFIAPLLTAFGSLAALISTEKPPALKDLADGLARTLAIVAPAREILIGENGLRDLREIVFEKAGNPDALINALLAELTRLIPAESVEVLKNFVATLKDFEAGIPSDPEAVAGFLAQSFLGVPIDLLAQPLSRIDALHEQIDALVEPARVSDLHLNIQATADQLIACRTLIENLDLGDTAAYQAAAEALKGVQAQMAAIQGRLGSLASGFQSGLAALDLGGFSAGLQNSLENFPEIRVAQVDDFLNLVTEPLRQLNHRLDEITPAQLAQAFAAGNTFFASMIADQGFDEIREALLQPFKAMGAAIEGLDLDAVRSAVTEALGRIGDGIDQVAVVIQNVRQEIQQVFAHIGNVLDTVSQAGGAVENGVDALAREIQNALNALQLAEFGKQIETVIERLGSLLSEFTATIGPALENLNALREELEKINLRRVAEPAFEAMQAVQAILEKLDLSLVAGDAAAAVRVSLDGLVRIDLSPLRQALIATYEQAVPRAPLDGLAENYQALVGKMAQYRPGNLLDPLLPPYAQLKAALHQFDPAALLTPVIPQLEGVQATLENIAPARLLVPLAQAFDALVATMDDLAPSKLLAPANAAFQDLMALFEKLNITPLIEELETLFTQWLEKSLTEVQKVGDAFGDAGDLRSYLDGIGATPAGGEFGFMPGDILRPVEDLFNKVMRLLDQVPDDRLLAAFEHLRAQLVEALQRISPAQLGGDLHERLRRRLEDFDFLNHGEVLGALFTPYSDLVLQFDAIDPVRVGETLRADFDALTALIIAVDPARVFAPLRGQFQTLNANVLARVGALDASGVAPLFGPVEEKVRALIPAFLQGELRLDGIKAQLQQLNPGRFADEVNQEFETFLLKLTRLGDTLVDELPKLAETVAGGTTAFVPDLVKEAFNAVYDPLKTQLEALAPAALIAELESGIFEPAKAALESLNPATFVDELELEAIFEAFNTLLDALIRDLKRIQATLADFWSALLRDLDPFDPARLQAQADAAFAPALEFIANLDLAGRVEAFDLALARIGNDLDKTLLEAETALQDMINAIPDG